MILEKKVREAAWKVGIDVIEFFTTEPLTECLEMLDKRYQSGLVTGFEGACPVKRINYQNYFELVKMGIAFGLNYYQGFEEPEDIKKRLKVASVAWGEDYHKVLNQMGTALMSELNALLPADKKINYKVFVDNSGLVDRGSAYRAGLGFFGKNNCLINEKLGSFFFIGQILIDQEIEFIKKKPVASQCENCQICIEKCPTGALGKDYYFDPRKCNAYLTQKKEISEFEEKYFKEYLYGCDLCQKYCPFNQKLKKTTLSAFYSTIDDKYPSPESILGMTNQKFKQRFKKTAAGWRGKKNLVRNANLIMKNRLKVI